MEKTKGFIGKIFRKPTALFAAAIMAVSAIFLVACTKPAADATLLESSETLVVIRAEETSGSLFEALKKFEEAGELTFEGSEGDYGFYITSVNGYVPDATKNEFWAVYTTLGEHEGVIYSSTEFGAYDYEGTTCGSASYGVSGLPMVEGNLYVLTVSTW